MALVEWSLSYSHSRSRLTRYCVHHPSHSILFAFAVLSKTRASKIALSRAIFVPGIWTVSLSHRSIFWPLDWRFRIRFVLPWRPAIPAWLPAFPRTPGRILIGGRAQTQAR